MSLTFEKNTYIVASIGSLKIDVKWLGKCKPFKKIEILRDKTIDDKLMYIPNYDK